MTYAHDTYKMRKDSQRLAQLRQQLILDSTAERAYDEVTRLLSTSLEVPITLINFMDEDRDWFKSTIGVTQCESPVETSFCEAFLRTADCVIVVSDATLDARFQQHPLVTGTPFVRFYAAARIVSAGHTLGTLCAYDMTPRKISVEQIETLRTLAGAVMELLSKRTMPATGGDQIQ